MKYLFIISVIIIFWTMIGYPVFLILLDRIFNLKDNGKLENYFPSVTVMVVAHNEEKVILKKLKNLENIIYPEEKIKILVTSDNSTDMTNEIVKNYITTTNRNVTLYEVKERRGKTNAQNEAQKLVDSEILVMTDANSMLKEDSIKEIVSSFFDNSIAYVTGKLVYTNEVNSLSSESEKTYWDLETNIRYIESKLQTITAGNGALYAIRNNDYFEIPDIESHDSSFPLHFNLNGRRAISNDQAIAYEKAGETIEEEYNRKVRMNRVLLRHILPSLKILNVFKYKWFTLFYLSHRTFRYLLWLAHIVIFFVSSILLVESNLYLTIFFLQVVVLLIILFNRRLKFDNKLSRVLLYYFVTILAQLVAVIKTATGNNKATWEKANSTRKYL